MKISVEKQSILFTVLTAALVTSGSAQAQTVVSVTTFVSGTAVNATKPDSICADGKSIWVSYGDDSVSTGGGNSTVVEYDLSGNVIQMFTLAGSVDGLKADPKGVIWALQNQDGNSTLTLINPKTGNVTPAIPYAVASATQGYDDVAFVGGKAFVSHTNPAVPTDPIIQYIDVVKAPISVTDVLLAGGDGDQSGDGPGRVNLFRIPTLTL